MKLEISEKGVFEGHEEIPVGEIVEVEGDKIPAYLVGKCRPLDQVAVTNPADGAIPIDPNPSAAERQELLKLAALEIEDGDFTADGRPDVRALNDLLTDDAQPFTADERDTLWPGVKEEVMAARGAN